MPETSGTFDVSIRPAGPEPDVAWNRMNIGKVWHGGVEGTGSGEMLSMGDPSSGSAGYVAIETVSGTVDGLFGTFALQQFGTMHAGDTRQHYAVVPGSGTGGLEGISGDLELSIDGGVHRYVLRYSL